MNKNSLIQKHFQKSQLLNIENPQYQKTVDTLFNWLLASDHAENDITAKFLNNKSVRASIRTKQDIIVAGIEEIEHLVKKYPEITFQKKINDGERLKKGGEIAVISGRSGTILSLERTILNVLQRMSGIATQTRKFARILSPIQIAATRKTPWMQLDKKAVALGGGLTHRLDLSDGILIKDNHLQILKNKYGLKNEEETVSQALQAILPKITDTPVEIEVTTKEGANAAIKAFFHSHCHSRERGNPEDSNNSSVTVMLDNWSPKDARNFIKKTLISSPDKGRLGGVFARIIFEASGNINESNLQDWAGTGVDIISSGALTHSAKAADLSLSITP